MIIETTDEKFADEVLHAQLPVIVIFKSEYCPVCKSITPDLEKVSEEYAGKVKFVFLDIIKNHQEAVSNRVLTIPVLIMFKNGREVARNAGYLAEKTLKFLIENNL